MSNAKGDGGAAAGADSNSEDHSAKPNGTQSTELNQGIRLAGHAFEGRLVRTVLGNGHGWFVAPDLCRGIGLRPNKGSYGHHIAKIDDDDKTQLGEGWATAGTPTPMFNMGVGVSPEPRSRR